MDHDVLDLFSNDLFVNIVAMLSLEVILELLKGPHVSWNVMKVVHCFCMLGDTVVGEM